MSKSGETKKKILYPKEKAFADKFIETGNGTKSALEVYDTDSENVAANIAHQNLRKPKIIDYIESKLSDEMLAEKHQELFNQKRIDYFVFPKSMTDEEIITHVNASGIEVITVRESDKGKMAFYSIPDSQAIKAGLDMAYKIKGKYKAEEKPPEEPKTVYNFLFTPEFKGRIKPLEEELKSQFKNVKPIE